MFALAHRSTDRRPLLAVSLGAQALGYSGLVMWPLESPYVWVALIGFGLGACFALSLILTLDHCRKPSEAARLQGSCKARGFLCQCGIAMADGLASRTHGEFCYCLVGSGCGGCCNAATDADFQPAEQCPGSVCRWRGRAACGALTEHGCEAWCCLLARCALHSR